MRYLYILITNITYAVLTKCEDLLTFKMDCYTIKRQFLIILIALSVDWTRAVKIVELNVPPLANPQDELVLDCRFDMGGEELNSVKWYKDEQEFFRFTPHQQPLVMSFPVAGVYLENHNLYEDNEIQCGLQRCIIRLTRLTTAHSGGSYRCEVSTEAPAFRVAFETANVTVAVLGRENPRIDGVELYYSSGDLVRGNCTTAPADPAPTITWFVNGVQAPNTAIGHQQTSAPNSQGLVTKSVGLRFHAEKRHFQDPNGILELQCVVRMPGIPVPIRATVATAALRETYQRNLLSKQKLFWPNNNKGRRIRDTNLVLLTSMCAFIFINS